MNIGHDIRRCRERLGLSLGEVARRANVSKAHLSQLERGLSKPSFEVVQRVVEALGMTLHSWFRSDDPLNDRDTLCYEELALLSAWRALPPEVQDLVLWVVEAMVRASHEGGER